MCDSNGGMCDSSIGGEVQVRFEWSSYDLGKFRSLSLTHSTCARPDVRGCWFWVAMAAMVLGVGFWGCGLGLGFR